MCTFQYHYMYLVAFIWPDCQVGEVAFDVPHTLSLLLTPPIHAKSESLLSKNVSYIQLPHLSVNFSQSATFSELVCF